MEVPGVSGLDCGMCPPSICGEGLVERKCCLDAALKAKVRLVKTFLCDILAYGATVTCRMQAGFPCMFSSLMLAYSNQVGFATCHGSFFRLSFLTCVACCPAPSDLHQPNVLPQVESWHPSGWSRHSCQRGGSDAL